MTEPDPEGIGPEHESAAALRRDRAQLERRVAELEANLATERNRLQRLKSRRSVRIALGIAQRSKVLLGPLQRLRRGNSAHPRLPDPAETLAALRIARSDPGPHEGPLVTIIIAVDGSSDPQHERVLRCLREATSYRTLELIMVGTEMATAATGPSESELGFPVRLIHVEDRQSPPQAFNIAISQAAGDYVMLLDHMVQPVSPGWLGVLVQAMESDSLLGAVTPMIVSEVATSTTSRLAVKNAGIGFQMGSDSARAAAYPEPISLCAGDDPASVPIETRLVPAAGADCVLIRTDLLRDLDGTDSGFLGNRWAADLSLRIAESGRHVAVVGAAVLDATASDDPTRGSAKRRVLDLSDAHRFVEKWAPSLSRSLRLESTEPGESHLDGRHSTTVAITVSDSDPRANRSDWLVAHELGEALEDRGFTVVYAEKRHDSWYDLPPGVSTIISLDPEYDARRAPASALTIAWVHSGTPAWISQPWFQSYDVFIPGTSKSAVLMAEQGVGTTSPIPLATNELHFRPRTSDPAYSADVTMSGNYRKRARHGIEKLIARHGETIRIYGRGWEALPKLRRYARGVLPYEDLASAFASTKVVVDDAPASARDEGSLSSTVFNAISSGALVITNNELGAQEIFDGALPVYHDELEQRSLLDKYLHDDELRTPLVESLRATTVSHHTYKQRAVEIPTAAAGMIRRPRIALKIGTPDSSTVGWGDTYFAHALAAELRSVGSNPSVHFRADWDSPASQCVDVVVHIRGRGTCVPKPSHKNILWIISHPEEVTVDECNTYDMVLVASDAYAKWLRSRVQVPVEIMYQATGFCLTDPDESLATDVLFVGNSRGQRRGGLEAARAINAPLSVYGQGWGGILPDDEIAGEYFPHDRLGALYASANVTLNDHWPEMAQEGFISNRIFDIIAAGGLVVTDPVAGLRDVFGDLVPIYDTPESLRGLLEDRRRNPRSYVSRMAEARTIVERDHTFKSRARRLMEICDELG